MSIEPYIRNNSALLITLTLIRLQFYNLGFRKLGTKCVKKHSLKFCKRCQHSNQCEKPLKCCPISRLCIKRGCSDCKRHEKAVCKPMCTDSMDPNDCTCKHRDFPDKWSSLTCQGIFIAAGKVLIKSL